MSSRVSLIVVLLFIAFASGDQQSLQAQDRCGTEKYMEKFLPKRGETKTDFEQWLKRSIKVKAKGTNRTGAVTYQIPVVVHIIHSGESHNSNIPDAQVLSQLKVLNDDYNRLNADAANTPSLFSSVAGSLDIEFVLAKRTPEGLPTNGIVRLQGPKTEWKVSDNYQLKSLSYWPAEDYLNIWVCNLTDYLGYAQFPQTNLLSGLQNSSSNRLTDGVVITHTAFGSVDDGSFVLQSKYNKGRTATHEIGHFFGLRHIWGDDDGACGGVGDYVDDTPDQADRTLNCPSHPRTTCGTVSMFQNFLDYTNDACMNIFTQGQADRMSVIIENSPRRQSLLTSPGLLEPEPVANDLGIREILTPLVGECTGEVTPAIVVRNYGNNTITSAEIVLKRNGIPLETKTINVSLPELEVATITFNAVPAAPGSSLYTFEILETNGVADGNTHNNTAERFVLVPQYVETPIVEQLESIPSDWQILNPDGLFTWEIANAVSGNPGNKALMMNFYDYEDNEGEIDVFLSPVIDLSDAEAAILLFDVSHAQYQTSKDGLRVVVLHNCNADVNLGDVIYSKQGSDLATTNAMNQSFSPGSVNDWRTESINLSAYLGMDGIQLAFIGVNDWGNNVYLDNIRVLSEDFLNLTLKAIVHPPPIVCNTAIEPALVVKNSGTNLSSFDIQYTINGVGNTHSVTGLDFEPGAEMTVLLPGVTLVPGTNELTFTVANPDGSTDVDPADNATSARVVSAKKESGVPFRESFETNFENKWTILAPKANATWKVESLANNKALVYEGFENPVVGDEAWLVSPVFDLTNETEASVFFDISYAVRNNISEVFQIRAAKGCDAPFNTIKSYTGTELTDLTSNVKWRPSTEDDWVRDQYIKLSTLAGATDVRLAFVINNKNGNNFYLDNIRFYLSEDPQPVVVEGAFNVYPNPARSGEEVFISFNLPELEDISIEIIDRSGKSISRQTYSSVLNQTFPLNFEYTSPGLYVVRVITSKGVHFSKFILY